MIRAFVALPLPDVARTDLARLQEGLGAGRPVPAENLHLTLAFLDDQPQAVLENLHEGLSRIAARPMELRIGGLDVFGGVRPRLLFAEVAPDPALVALRKVVRCAARQAGIDLPHERFRPHVSLARFRRDMGEGEALRLGSFLKDHAAYRLDPIQVRCLALYRSQLRPDGAVHERLADYPLI